MGFFDDIPLARRKDSILGVPPPIPDTGWRPPQEWPDLTSADAISFDTETKDPELEKFGPGWARGRGHIVGFSIAAQWAGGRRWSAYFPIRHEVEPEWNLDPVKALAWLRVQLSTRCPKIGANLMYDVGWLGEEGIEVAGELLDVQYAEALLSEDSVALDWLARKYTGGGKDTRDMYEWLAKAYGGEANEKQRRNIWRTPPRLVGPYGEADAIKPIEVMTAQWSELVRQELIDLFKFECRQIPLLIKMRRQGVPVDVVEAERLYGEYGRSYREVEAELKRQTGIAVNVNSAASVAKMFDHIGVHYPTTSSGNPSFTDPWLKAQTHPAAKLVKQGRAYIKLRSTFLKGYILEPQINGLIFPQLHPLKGDENGAKTGRYASSDPNIQNLPVRTEEGKAIRSAFVPFPGHVKWIKKDYSQIEYRMLAHFATDAGDGSADRLRQSYIDDPNTDYHTLVQQNVLALTGIEIDRRPIKNINFGLLYGQSQKQLAVTAGLSQDQAGNVFAAYHKGAPYVKPTMKAIADEVQREGMIRTIMGRRVRFDLWEPSNFGERGGAYTYDQAVRMWGYAIRRAYDYRGVNYKLQGSAAEVIKAAMVKSYEDGVYDVTGYPLMQIHDELDFSMIEDSPVQREAHEHMNWIMENAITARVPIKIDVKDGPNWGAID